MALSSPQTRGRGGANLAIGVFLALGAVFLATLPAYGFRWAADLASDLSRNHERRNRLELFGVIIGLAIHSLPSLFFVASAGFARNEPISSNVMIYGVAGGLLLQAFGGILWRRANLIASNLEINVLGYFTPALALGWLFAFSQVGDIGIGYLLIGVAIIIAANLGMYIETRESQKSAEADAQAQVRESLDLDALIAGESETVEFKSTLRTHEDTDKRDRTGALEFASLKTMAAFLNTEGGTLIIGINDKSRKPVADNKGRPIGILRKDGFPDEDRMKLHVRNIVTRSMGAIAMTRIHMEFHDYQESKILELRCDKATRATYVDGRLFIRTGPATTELFAEKALEYIRDWFPD